MKESVLALDGIGTVAQRCSLNPYSAPHGSARRDARHSFSHAHVR
jgi:hypothetical protein